MNVSGYEIEDDTAKYMLGLISLSTHRDPNLGPDATSYFRYENAIAAISILFFRLTVRSKSEPRVLCWLFAILLASLAYLKKSYELICAVEIFSYAASWLLLTHWPAMLRDNVMVRLLAIAGSAAASLVVSHLLLSPSMTWLLSSIWMFTPTLVKDSLSYLFPIPEFTASYDIMLAFANPHVLRKQVGHLLFVTFHIQVGMGFLGIDFLKEEQSRRNQLVRMDLGDVDDQHVVQNNGERSASSRSQPTKGNSIDNNKLVRAKRFQRGAAPFIVFVAMPYMLQIILFGNINKFAFTCLEHDLHRIVRLNEIFEDHNNLAAMTADSTTSPETYASAMSSIVNKAYEIINRKLFSLPKILLLPGVMSRQPMLMINVFPFIFISDWIKASLVSYMTTTVEELRKEVTELRNIRTKVESFDLKNSELLQRSGPGVAKFTQRRWEELTVKIQLRENVADLFGRSKAFFAFMQRNFVFTVLIDCALASLMAIGKITASEIFLFSRAVEDAVDLVLMRSRSEAELAQMMTETEKLQELANLWAKQKKHKTFLPCRLATKGEAKGVVLRNLHYSRGTASVRADHVFLPPGIYALTGANGSGKSTLFRVLMSCCTNNNSIELPESINLYTPAEPLTEEDDIMREVACVSEVEAEESIECEERPEKPTEEIIPEPHPRLSIIMPSSDVVEISQNFYWPLYSKPIEWIYQGLGSGLHLSDVDRGKYSRTVAELLQSLGFLQPKVAVEATNATKGGSSFVVSGDGGIEQEDKSKFIEDDESIIRKIQRDLQEEKEDWFSNLSGGQKSKVELVRKVFLHERCPDVLLIDETMAPLDPASKLLVMAKLKSFCAASVVIVIYHTDVGREVDIEGRSVDCVPSTDFFDQNIHLVNGLISIRRTCENL